MRILFFAPLFVYNTYTPPTPLGLLSIASYLQVHGNHIVKIVDRNISSTDTEKELESFRPDIVGVSLLSSAVLKDGIALSRICHDYGKSVVWGGHFASACYDIVLKEDFVDIVSVGEGEETWSLLLSAIENGTPLSSVTGIAYKDGEETILNPLTPHICGKQFVRNDYSLIDVPAYYTKLTGITERMIWVFAAKGCYNQCTFCCNKYFHRQEYRKRDYDDVCDEIKELVTKYKADGFYFGDELWCANKEEMIYNCDRLKELNLDFVWGCFLRVGILDREGYQYLYDHGCRWIFFGIESGSEERLKKVKKGIHAADVTAEIKACYDIGIRATCSFMLGFPDETPQELAETANLMKKLSYYSKLDVYYFSPYVGSELYNKLVADGKISPFNSIYEADKPIWSSLNTDMLKQMSSVPPRVLKVIFSRAMYWSDFNFGKEQKQSSAQLIRSLFKKIYLFTTNVTEIHADGSPKLLFILMRDVIKKYISVFFNVLCFPGIKKEYNL